MKKRMVDSYKGVDDYIAYQEPALQPMLKKIRATIQSLVPDAEECISYMIPCYKLDGMLVGFGTHKKGCSFYTMNPVMLSSFAGDLKGITYSSSTLHLEPGKAVPVALLKKLTKYRIKENKERAALKRDLQISKPKKTIR